MSLDLIIRGAQVVNSEEVRRLDIGVRDGRIAALLTPDADVEAARTLHADGLIALPGGIDTHTHVHWPFDGKFTVDDFASASRAAALGGTTTIIDFVPPANPGQTLAQACQARVDQAIEQGAEVDFAFHAILTSADDAVLADIPRVINAGFTSFKMYTTFEGRRINDSDALLLMQVISEAGGMPGFHAENDEIIEGATNAQARRGETDPAVFAGSRPAMAEVEAIQMVALYARRLDTPVWIYHVSGADALQVITDARRLGTDIHVETCAHYLAFDQRVYEADDAWRFVICPPIRERRDRDALWAAVSTGEVSAVATDHCAYSIRDKTEHVTDHRHIPAGAPGIGARGPVLWDVAVNKYSLPLPVVAAAWAENAARGQGLFPAKGIISVGSDADIVLWDPDGVWSGAELPAVEGPTFSLYERMSGRGSARHVLRRGEFLVTDGEWTGGNRTGRFLARAPGAHHADS